ncbi:MAG TPA: FoF1 ATP synthase subunit a [Bryobacteraceae bacterium]|nr:FoF1 ATP synthase subunit a [Bryobacteraceae bacterium]
MNSLLAKPVLALLGLLHIQPANPEYPIPNFLAAEIVVVLVAMIFFLWLKGRISAERPGATQQTMELLLTNSMGVGIKDLLDEIVGHGAERHLPLLGTIAIFILFSNMISLIPGMVSPTAANTVPLACATIVFLYYNWFGFAKHGPVGYVKTLMGPVPAISPLMVLVETVSHFARVLSLTVRLWVNMMVSELIFASFLGLTVALFVSLTKWNPIGYIAGIVPIAIPGLLAGFHLFEAVLQTFIFVMLSIVYLGFAVAEEH